MKWLILSLNILFFIVTGCGNPSGKKAVSGETGHEHEGQAHFFSVTKWTGQFELFMEYEEPILSEAVPFIIHLTRMDTFKPVTQGTVTLSFKKTGSEKITRANLPLAETGIFTSEITLPDAGEYLLSLIYKNDISEYNFDIGEFHVFASEQEKNGDHEYESEHAHEQEENHAENITFLKEQQWRTDFETQECRIMPVKSSITAIGEVIPKQSGYADIVSPVEGLLNVQYNRDMVFPGKTVTAGEKLVTLSPPAIGEDSWTDKRLGYEKAQKEYERAKNLLQRQAISQREFEQVQKDYLLQKAGYESILNLYGIEQGENKATDNMFLNITTPINGIVHDIMVLPGQKVSPGQKLMTIIDPSTVWLKVDIFEKDFYQLGAHGGASAAIPGKESPVILNTDQLKLLSKGNIVDPQSRTIPFLFEVRNKENLFRIGQFLQLELYTTDEKRALAVPKSCIIDEDVQKIVFVQHRGESFEKRIVKTGPAFKDHIIIKDGLHAGERVVTRGAYQVKLASMNNIVGHGHIH
ncbi:efflux RND transporter periplasmic adaptor subunit [candidate division KSB1 bacterium]|nr:efflux RND transporter periplasmic adaptor subunit [candidate division KSB1 bacterium]